MHPMRSMSRTAICQWIVGELKDGPKPAGDVRRRAGEAGIKMTRLKSAKMALGVQSIKTGFSGTWVWALPSQAVDFNDGKTWESAAREALAHGDESPAKTIPDEVVYAFPAKPYPMRADGSIDFDSMRLSNYVKDKEE